MFYKFWVCDCEFYKLSNEQIFEFVLHETSTNYKLTNNVGKKWNIYGIENQQLIL